MQYRATLEQWEDFFRSEVWADFQAVAQEALMSHMTIVAQPGVVEREADHSRGCIEMIHSILETEALVIPILKEKRGIVDPPEAETEKEQDENER